MLNESPDYKKIDLYTLLLLMCIVAPAGYYAFGLEINFWLFFGFSVMCSLIVRHFRLRRGRYYKG